MTIILDLNPETEKSLVAQANQRGVSLHDYLQQIIAREAGLSVVSQPTPRAENLSDLLLNSPFAGANLDLERYQDYPRPTDLE